MNYRVIIIAILFALIGQACKKGRFKEHETGLKYKFFIENSDAPQPGVGDIVALSLEYTNAQGEVIEASDLFRTQLKEPSHQGGSIEDALAMMHLKDSAAFKIKAEDYFTYTKKTKVPLNVDPAENLVFYIKLLDIISVDEFEKERRAARVSNEREEEKRLEDYLKRANITEESTMSGLYIITKEPGSGPTPEPGKKVTVHYSGYFIDGRMFNSSYERKEPFEFNYGVGEVIQGWDEGLATMKEGGKYQLIIPSYLAYGSEQTGPIPPYSTLIFDIELLHVEK